MLRVKRPILWIAISFAAGVAIATQTPGWSAGAPILALCGVIFIEIRRHDRRFFMLGMVALFCAAGILRWDLGRPNWAGDPLCQWIESASPERVAVEGRVRQSDLFAPGDDYLQFVIDVSAVQYRTHENVLDGRMLVRWNAADRPVFVGDVVRVRGEPSVVLSPVNWDVHSNEDSLRRRGIHSIVRCRGVDAITEIAPGSRWRPFNASGRFRQALAERLTNAVPESAHAFIFAVWLGDRSQLTREQNDSFVRSGTAHILAVSGVHTSIVFVTVSFILGRFIPIARYRATFIIVAIAVFALTAGARIATFRAAMMIAVYVLADVFDRERDAPTALGTAGFLFLIWDPSLLLDGGAQLSFLSIASILLFGDALAVQLPLLKEPIRHAVTTTLSVQLLPLPLAASMFHMLPRLAPLANLIVVPMLGVLLWLCLITTIAAFVSPPLALIFGHAAGGIAIAIQAIANAVASFPFSTQFITKPTAIAATLYWIALMVVVVPSRIERKHRLIATTTLMAISFLLWRPWGLPAQVRILDVAHGDAAVVYSSTGEVAVIDGGDHSAYVDMGTRVVIPTLSAMGVSHIDYLFVSHSDRDHLGGLIAVADRLSVRQVIMGPADPTNPVEQEFLAVCERRRIPVTRVIRGDRFKLGDAAFTVLHPPKPWPGSHARNDQSVVMRLDWAGPAILFTGDIEEPAERALLTQVVHAPILKAPHHGSDSSSTTAFLDAVAPETVLISVGDSFNRISNPGAVLARYRHVGAAVWSTNRSGGLRLEARKGRVHIEGARPARGYPGASGGDP